MKYLLSIACLASSTWLVTIDKISGELYAGTVLGPILAGGVAAIAATKTGAENA